MTCDNEPVTAPAKLACKDIPDDVFLSAVDQAARQRSAPWANLWDVAAALADFPGCVPVDLGDGVERMALPLVLTKARRLIARRVLRGCACGCRGDFERAS